MIGMDHCLGHLTKVKVWHDNSGLSPAWYVHRIIIRDLQSGQRYYFHANKWLSPETKDGVIEHEIPVTGKFPNQRYLQGWIATFETGWEEWPFIEQNLQRMLFSGRIFAVYITAVATQNVPRAVMAIFDQEKWQHRFSGRCSSLLVSLL